MAGYCSEYRSAGGQPVAGMAGQQFETAWFFGPVHPS